MEQISNTCVITQYKQGLSIKSIVKDYLAVDKARVIDNGCKSTMTIKEARICVYEILRKYWNEVYANGTQDAQGVQG